MTNAYDKQTMLQGPQASQVTVPVEVAKRQARDSRLFQFDGLAAFANLGDTLESLRYFRTRWPAFFEDSPSQFSRPGFRNLEEWLFTFAEEWTSYPPEVKSKCVPPLFWYRDLLRAVWTRNDPDGTALSVLLGLEDRLADAALATMTPTAVIRPALIPDQSLNPGMQETEGLPRGWPVVDGINGIIRWEFGSQLQRGVYDLMGDRWRAMLCPGCGKYFIAAKTPQKYCSPHCFGESRAKASLEFYHRKGKFLRAQGPKNSKKRR